MFRRETMFGFLWAMSTQEIVPQAMTFAPHAVLIGHSGSTSGHPSVVEVTRALRAALPAAWIIYGGVFPTFTGARFWPSSRKSISSSAAKARRRSCG